MEIDILELTLLPLSGLAASSEVDTVRDDVIAAINIVLMIMPTSIEPIASSLPGTEIG